MTRRNVVPESVSMETPQARKAEAERRKELDERRRIESIPSISARDPGQTSAQPVSLPEALASRLPTGASRDAARMVLHGLARTGNTILRAIDIPNRVFGNTRSLLQDIYEKSEENLARDAYEDRSGVPQFGETAVHLASAGVLGKALPAVFGANVGADTYETAKDAGASEGEALAKGVGHGVVDTAIWTLGQGLSSKLLPKAWQWLGRTITGAGRGAASSVTSDAVLNSLGADIVGDEMAKRAVHAAWMVPLLGMLKMGGKRREEAMSILRKARPDLAGAKAGEVIDVLENEFSDRNSQVTALQWVARKGANLPDDLASIKGAIEAYGRAQDAVKAIPHMRKELNGLAAEPPKADPRDEAKRQARIERLTRNLEAAEKLNEDFSSGPSLMKRSPFEIISNENYARFLPRPNPKDVKAFSNMKRYPMGVIGFDVSDDAAGRQATREMINAYMSPSSNPWCLATGKGAKKLGELGPDAENFWKMHSAVPKQIFFQDMEGDGNLALIAFRATGRGGEGRQEYWDTSDAPYSGIPIRVKVPGDPLGRYQQFVFKPKFGEARELMPDGTFVTHRTDPSTIGDLRDMIARRKRAIEIRKDSDDPKVRKFVDEQRNYLAKDEAELEAMQRHGLSGDSDVLGTLENAAPNKLFKGDPFRDGRSQTWVRTPERPVSEGGPIQLYTIGPEAGSSARTIEDAIAHRDRLIRVRNSMPADERDMVDRHIARVERAIKEYQRPVQAQDDYVLTEDKVRTTENGITKFRTTKYADPRDQDYAPPKPGEQPKPVEIEDSEIVSPEWMRARGYDPDNEADTRRMQREVNIQPWGNGMEAAMSVVPTKRTYMRTRSGTPETVTYEPTGRDIVSVDFTSDGVPYRQEYFRSGPKDADPSAIYQTFGYDDFPHPSGFYASKNAAEPSGSRLVRDPYGASPEVLNEVQWDEGLGSFVRTSGNRRWRMSSPRGPEALDPDTRRRIQIVEDGLTERLTRFDMEGASMSEIESMGPIFVDGREALSGRQAAQATRWASRDRESFNGRYYPLYSLLRTEAPLWLRAKDGWPKSYELEELISSPRMIIEDRQPDGTWATAVDRGVDADTGKPVELPPAPPERPVMDAKGGETRAAAEGGDAEPVPGESEVPAESGGADSIPLRPSGPRIVINPSTFRNRKDALCVAFNERFRIAMEQYGFEPRSEPTPAQRRFFADTAYADDEVQLRRTILARILTLDTSIS